MGKYYNPENMETLIDEISKAIKETVKTFPKHITVRTDTTLEDIKKYPDEGPGLPGASSAEKEVAESGASIKGEYILLSEGNFSGRLHSISNKRKTVSQETGEVFLEGDKIILSIKNHLMPKLLTSTKVLHKELLTRAISTKQQVVKYSLDEYMEKRGLQNRQQSKISLMQDLDILFNASYRLEISKEEYTYATHIIDEYDITKQGYVTLRFSDRIYKAGLKDSLGYVNKQLLQIDFRRHPNAYELGTKIWEHLKLKKGIISVKKLLGYCPEIPTYETVMKEDKHVSNRIIDPFEKALDYLSNLENNSFCKWEYCKAKKEPLSNSELEKATTYKFWETLYVNFILSESFLTLEEEIQKTAKNQKKKKKKN